MSSPYILERDEHGYARAISRNGHWLIHLERTVRTEENAEQIVRRLNDATHKPDDREQANG